MKRGLAVAIYGLSSLIGLVAFTYPLVLPNLERFLVGDSGEVTALRVADAPLLTTALLVLCLGLLFIELQGQAVSAKVVAALGMLVAVSAMLRLLETVIPGPGGFSLVFGPIILAGYVFGARFGFLMGALTLVVSALLTGGVGPWLPYQMLAAGWVGATAGWLPHIGKDRLQITLLAAFGFIWGVLFGLIMNLYFWPFIAGDPAMSWQPGSGLFAALTNYGAFYLTTSLWWDVIRGLGNATMVLILGAPTLRALTRFQERFSFRWQHAG